MSLNSLLTKLWNQIKNLFGGLSNELKIAVQIGIVITENIKTFVDSSTADILTAIIPGNIDNIMSDKLKQALPVLLCELKLVESSLTLTQPDAIVKAATEVIKTLDKSIRPGILHHLSILIMQVASDGKLSWGDAVYLSQWYYEQKFKQSTN